VSWRSSPVARMTRDPGITEGGRWIRKPPGAVAAVAVWTDTRSGPRADHLAPGPPRQPPSPGDWDLRLPTLWLGEIFANLALPTFAATQRPEQLETLEALSTVGAKSRRLGRRMRSDGYSTLEELETHYTGGEHPMDPLNYVWYQYRWQRLAARVFETDGEEGLVRLWDCLHARDRFNTGPVEREPLGSLLGKEVSETLGQASAIGDRAGPNPLHRALCEIAGRKWRPRPGTPWVKRIGRWVASSPEDSVMGAAAPPLPLLALVDSRLG